MKYVVCWMAILMAGASVARTPEGTLGLIQSPHNAWPTVLRPGENFQAVLLEPATLRLVGAEAGSIIALESAATPDGTYRVSVPATTPPGVYALEAQSSGGADTNIRAVYVVETLPDSYILAHIAAPAAGGATAFDAALQAANSAGAHLCIVTGNLTASGQPTEFRDFLTLLDASAAPTYVVPGPKDTGAGLCAPFLGQADGVFWYGLDGYLAIDTTLPVPVDPLGDDVARLQIRRRSIKAARWSVGFASRYVPRMNMRAQLILFADDALDYLLLSEIEALDEAEEAVLPWGATLGLVPAPEAPGVLLHVTPRGLAPWVEPVEAVTETADQPDPAP